jgi:IS4 transposase
MKQNPLNNIDVIELLVHYNCSLDGTPVIPGKLYMKNRDSLNLAWQKHLHEENDNQ